MVHSSEEASRHWRNLLSFTNGEHHCLERLDSGSHQDTTKERRSGNSSAELIICKNKANIKKVVDVILAVRIAETYLRLRYAHNCLALDNGSHPGIPVASYRTRLRERTL